MPFETLYRCTNCGWTGNFTVDHEDCPKDPMKDPKKRAEYEAWEAEFDRRTRVWEDWQTEHAPHIETAYPSIDHDPTEVAVRGEVVLVLAHDEFWGEGEDYTSEVLKDPTWGEVLACFEEAIKTTGDYHHSFLEGLCVPNEPGGEVATVEFSTGS